MKLRSLSGFFAASVVLVFFTSARADITPLDEAVPEAKATAITCALPNTELVTPVGKMALKPAEYHYQVYLPAGYKDSGKREYPCLFISMAGGNATPGVFLERLAKDHMMAVCLTEAKNGPWEPIVGNFLAAHDDAVKRFRIANHFKFMTGFSGGARAASIDTSLRQGFGALFLQGAGFGGEPGYNFATVQTNPGLAIYGVFGIGDPNRDEPVKMQYQMPQGVPHKFVLAEGEHHGATKESADEALDYLDEIVYVHRPLNDKPAMEQYAIRFNILLERAKTQQGFEKLETLEAANRIAMSRKLVTDKTLVDAVNDAAKQLKEMTAQPEMVKEAQARAAYFKIRDTEDANWIPLGPQAPQLSAFAKQAAPAYEAMAKKFEGTVYAQKATDRATWLAKGIEKTAPKEKPGTAEK